MTKQGQALSSSIIVVIIVCMSIYVSSQTHTHIPLHDTQIMQYKELTIEVFFMETGTLFHFNISQNECPNTIHITCYVSHYFHLNHNIALLTLNSRETQYFP